MDGLVSILKRSRKTQSDLVSNESGWWARLLGPEDSAGVDVNAATAKTSSAYWACSTAISADIAKLPIHLYQRRADDGREVADKHPAYRLLRVRPNPEMTAFSFREKLEDWALNWGNGCAEIERSNGGDPIALWPLKPWRLRLRRDQKDDRLYYEYTNPSGRTRDLDPSNVFHVRGPTHDGIVGLNIVALAQISLGVAMAGDRFAASFYANRAQPSAILEHPGKFKDKTVADRLRESFEKMYAGAKNAGRVAILEEGMQLKTLTMPLADAQFLEQRQFSVQEVCRWFRFPPHKAADLTRATFSNIEHQSLEYVTDCLMPWMVRWEEEAAAKLLRADEQGRLYFEHNTDALLRGDTKSRFEAYQKGLDSGALNLDEVRAKENMNPLPDGQGKVFRVPVNMQTVKQLIEGKPAAAPKPPKDPATPPQADPTRQAAPAPISIHSLVRAFQPAFEQAYRNLLRLEADKLTRAAAKGEAQRHAEDFYGRHGDAARSFLFPTVESLVAIVSAAGRCECPANTLVFHLAAAHCEASARQIREGLNQLEAVAKSWQETEPAARASAAIEMICEKLGATPKG